MRQHLITVIVTLAGLPISHAAPVSPTEELRATISEWVETMRKIQKEENDWTRDEEVLKNYREGLKSEIETLKEQIADAKTRNQGFDAKT